MKEIKQNLRDLLDFLTYFGNDFEDWYVQIISHQNYSEFKASTNKKRITFVVDKKWLMGHFGEKFIEIDLTKTHERISLSKEVKNYIKRKN